MRPRRGLKKIFIILAALVLLAVAAIFIYRYQLLQYSAEKIVRKFLPGYITVEKMSFDFRNNRLAFEGFRIINPPGYSGRYLVEIGEMECRYRMNGKSLTDGIELLNPLFKSPSLFIQRLPDGRTNLRDMAGFLEKKSLEAETGKPEERLDVKPAADVMTGPGRNLSDFVKLPEDFTVKDGKVLFLDGMVKPGPYTVSIDKIDANLHLRLDSSYTRALAVATTGSGVVNGRPGQSIKWDTKLDPTAGQLTMSNRFDVSGVDITYFSPYYDRYSPFTFRGGYFSGVLIFDFDNGSIGSTCEVALSDLTFSVKRGFENAPYLETTVPELVKYFTSASGDVIFDFKIKGPMSAPQFYLGPISKQAVASMVLDKVAQALSEAAREQANPQGAPQSGEGQSDIEKAAEYIKMFKGLMKGKN